MPRKAASRVERRRSQTLGRLGLGGVRRGDPPPAGCEAAPRRGIRSGSLDVGDDDAVSRASLPYPGQDAATAAHDDRALSRCNEVTVAFRCGVDVGPFPGRLMVVLRSMWGRFAAGGDLGSISCRLGAVPWSIWGRVGVVPSRFRVDLGSMGGRLVVVSRSIWGRSGVELESSCGRVGVDLEGAPPDKNLQFALGLVCAGAVPVLGVYDAHTLSRPTPGVASETGSARPPRGVCVSAHVPPLRVRPAAVAGPPARARARVRRVGRRRAVSHPAEGLSRI